MKTKVFAFITFLALYILAAPSCHAVPAFLEKTLAFFYTVPGKPYYWTKSEIDLPLKKNSKSVVCVNRNFVDTQTFGNAFCAALDEYSFDCMVKLAEFIPKEAVVGYDYVWTFQVKGWKDKNLDGVPEKVRALVLLYDRDFKPLLKSSVKIRKSKDPQAPACLETLVKEYLNSVFNEVVEAKPSESEKSAAKSEKADKKAKKDKKKKDKKNAGAASAEEAQEAAADAEAAQPKSE